MVNKKQLILVEAKRLFGCYGYLGFTLKQLAQACHMTSPALYYFYTSKAELFKDCVLSEITIRQAVFERSMAQATTLPEFAHAMAHDIIEVCASAAFRVGQAMRETVHLPLEMQQELRTAWDTQMLAPVEQFLARMLPEPPSQVSYRLLATYVLSLATFSAVYAEDYPPEELAALIEAIATGLQTAAVV
ncbi:MAG TPA: helix-turn-helix domain-containing protein [Armatimonadota bacterium]|jgi:AcrR family transcriptional regulator